MKQLELVRQVEGLYYLYANGQITRGEFKEIIDDTVRCYYQGKGEFEIYEANQFQDG